MINKENISKNQERINLGDITFNLNKVEWIPFSGKDGSMFKFFAGWVDQQKIAVGYGRRKVSISGLRSDSTEFMDLCAADYTTLLTNYPKATFPYLLPKQTLVYGNHYKDNKPTVICVREHIDIQKDISKLKQADFVTYPDLKDELINFFVYTRANSTKPDIQSNENLIIGRDGHLHLIDVNTLFTPGSGAQYERIIRTQRTISYMLNGYNTFQEAYKEAIIHDLTP